MNPTRIDYVDVTWNVFPGCPPPNCYYCYAKRQLRRHVDCDDCFNFRPHVHEERLHQPFFVKVPKRIFADSTGDPLKWASDAWINLWIEVMRECPWHTFMILTKNPARYEFFEWPENVWLGATVDNCFESWNLKELADLPNENIKFVSFEPLLDSALPCLAHHMDKIDWVIVGAMTGPGSGEHPVDPLWVQEIIDVCSGEDLNSSGTLPLFLKNNLHWPEKIQEYPEVMD